MAYGTFSGRKNVQTFAGSLPYPEQQQQPQLQQAVAPQMAQAVPPPPQNMRDFRNQRRQNGMTQRSNIGMAGRMANVATANPLAADLATGGAISNRANANAFNGAQVGLIGSQAGINDAYAGNMTGMLPVQQQLGRSEAGLNNARSWGIGQEAGQNWAKVGMEQRAQSALLPPQAAKAGAEAAAAPYQLGANVNLTNAEAGATRARTDDVSKMYDQSMKMNTALQQQNQQLVRMRAPDAAGFGAAATLPQSTAGKQLDEATARRYMQQAGNDPEKARELARADGYQL